MILRTDCPDCHAKDVTTWTLVKREGGLMKICSECGDKVKQDATLSTEYYESAKKKAEAHRKVKNEQVLRSYRIARKGK